jgi:hypothetical protein
MKASLRGILVDLVRFELTTSSMPWKRAPNCATGPLVRFFNISHLRSRIAFAGRVARCLQ